MLNSFYQLLRGEPAEEIVWTADISYWLTGQKIANTVKPEWEME
jgi:hypothetical protein